VFFFAAQSPASNPQAPTLAQAQMAELKQTTLGVTLSELNAAWRTKALEGLEESHKP
jgi:ABC-type sugar transport system substrate-binding protein